MKKTIEYGNITLMDEVETEEADRLIEKMSHKYAGLVIVPLILLVVVASIMFGVGVEMNIAIGVTVVLAVIFVVCLLEYGSILNPYYKLKKIAELNDRVRHEEKIRVRERKRLEQTESEEVSQIKRSDIDNTFEKMDIQQ